jgi:hypothetical protein
MTETYIVVIAHAVGNPEAGYDIVHDWDGRQFPDKAQAAGHGFALADSDDFNIGVVRDGRLASLWWLDKELDETAAMLAEIGAEIGLKA